MGKSEWTLNSECYRDVERWVEAERREASFSQRSPTGRPRYEAINREQLCWRRVDVERLIGEEHPARAVWEFVGQLDMSGYQGEARAVEGKAGRPGWDRGY